MKIFKFLIIAAIAGGLIVACSDDDDAMDDDMQAVATCDDGIQNGDEEGVDLIGLKFGLAQGFSGGVLR